MSEGRKAKDKKKEQNRIGSMDGGKGSLTQGVRRGQKGKLKVGGKNCHENRRKAG